MGNLKRKLAGIHLSSLLNVKAFNRLKLERLYLLGLFLTVIVGCATNNGYCTNDWKVTGYYSPIEGEYKSSIQQTIAVRKVGVINFNSEFLKDVRMEGWGKTRFGWYLGYYSSSWHKSNAPLDSKGGTLDFGSAAIDRSYLEQDTVIRIPEIESVLGISDFVGSDTGSAIQHKHIDIYTGEGLEGKRASWKVTGSKQVCIASN